MKLCRLAVVACLALPTLAACSTTASPSPAATQMTYTCCDAKDVDTLYQPGQAMTVHWIVTPENGTAEGSPQVELAARLTGPYATVAELKAATSDTQGASGDVTFAAAPVRPSSTAGEQPVSTILIGSDAKPGYYNLIFSVTQRASDSLTSGYVRIWGVRGVVDAPGHR